MSTWLVIGLGFVVLVGMMRYLGKPYDPHKAKKSDDGTAPQPPSGPVVDATTKTRKDYEPPWWVTGGLLALIVVSLGYACSGSSGGGSTGDGHLDAITRCQIVMKAAARDPDTAQVPYIDGARDSAGTWTFRWSRSTKLMRMRNGLGLEVPVEGLCSYRGPPDSRVVLVELDGKVVYDVR